MLPIISNLICPAIALSLGLIAYRSMNRFWRLLFFQTIAYGVTLIISYIVTTYQKLNGQDENTLVIYNVFMLIEMFMLMAAAHIYFNTPISKYLTFLGYGLFLLVFIAQIYHNGFATFANYASAAQNTILALFYGAILYRQFFFHSTSPAKSPEIWMTIGLLAFLVGCIPYITMINYMQRNFPMENIVLYANIINFLSVGRYSLLALGFFLVHRNTIKINNGTHE